jgi:hypothetical protein
VNTDCISGEDSNSSDCCGTSKLPSGSCSDSNITDTTPSSGTFLCPNTDNAGDDTQPVFIDYHGADRAVPNVGMCE